MYKKIFQRFASFGVVLGVTVVTLGTSLSKSAASTNPQTKQVTTTEQKRDKNQPPVQPSVIQPSLTQPSVIQPSKFTGSLLKKIPVTSGAWKVARSVAVSPESPEGTGHMIVSGDDRGKVQLWSKQTGELIRTFNGHSNWVQSVAIAPDAKVIASGSVDGTIKLWQPDGKLLLNLKNSRAVYSIGWSPDGKILASGDGNGELKLWKRDGKLIRSIEAHSGNIVSVAISPVKVPTPQGSAKVIASRSFGDEKIKLWNLNTGKLIRSLSGGSVGGVNSLAISPDGKFLAGYFRMKGDTYSDGAVRIWGLETGEVFDTFDVKMNRPHAIAFSPNGKTLAVGGFGSEIQIWSMSAPKSRGNFQIAPSLPYSGHVYSLTFSPDGKTLVGSGAHNGGNVAIWSISE